MARSALPRTRSPTSRWRSAGADRIAWAAGQMPVLAQVAERFQGQRPLGGIRIAACLHVTAETANLVRALRLAGAEVALCSANPLATQDEVAAALVAEYGVEVRARRGESFDAYQAHIASLIAGADPDVPWVTIDDGADLVVGAHETVARRYWSR